MVVGTVERELRLPPSRPVANEPKDSASEASAVVVDTVERELRLPPSRPVAN